MLKDLGAKAFSYGYASPVLMAATYNDDGTINVMNLHEGAQEQMPVILLAVSVSRRKHTKILKKERHLL